MNKYWIWFSRINKIGAKYGSEFIHFINNNTFYEGINFLFQNNIVEIKGNNKVEKLELIKTELVQKEGETRLSPVNIEGSNYIINADYIIMALGSNPDKIVNTLGLELDKWNNIKKRQSS